ncbi:MAG: insulinase family protein [Candidatus Staskawiczbacteria bacterium]|nr:insulinase family protein [Candidatus Staskawiczbacteria bacterium]
MWDPYAEFESAVLPNGLTVYAAHWPERPWEAMGFLVHSGAEQDPVGLEGLAHFVEHMVSKNAILSRKEISAFFEDCGGWVNTGETGHMCAQYNFFAPAEKEIIAKAFSIFGHMMLSEKLGRFIERERQVIIGEFHEKYPTRFASFDLEMQERKTLYPGYWLERFPGFVFGTPESVKKITQNDLQTYYDANYTPANISVVGVGRLKLDEIVNLLSESNFGVNKNGQRTELPCCVKKICQPIENRYVFEYSKHISMQEPIKAAFYRTAAVIPGDVNTAIGLLKHMLDEILDDEIRQSRAWTYNIHCSWCNLRHFHEFSINCKALKLEAVDFIEDIIETCIASLEGRNDLFEKIKKRAIASNRLMDQRGIGICNGALNDLSRFYKIISLAEYEKKLEAVQMSDIQNLLQWIGPERRWTLIKKP